MGILHFHIEGAEELLLEPTQLINAGYTGRDQKAVQDHVEELKAAGIPAPEKTPCFFPKAAELIRQSGKLSVLDADCSSEVEAVLLVTEDAWYITVGCDIFDSRVETFRADKSKCLYPNYLAASAWRYEDVKGHWDQLMLRSWIGKDRQTLYQEGSLAQILRMEDEVQALEPHLKHGLMPGTILSGGTLSCLVPGFPFAEVFSFELEDPVLGRKIEGEYEIGKIAWFQA